MNDHRLSAYNETQFACRSVDILSQLLVKHGFMYHMAIQDQDNGSHNVRR